MITLVTLPGLRLDSPDIYMPSLKGFLKNNGYECKHWDCNIASIYSKLCYEKIVEVLNRKKSIDIEKKVKEILDAIDVLCGKIDSDYETYLKAGNTLKNAMRLFSEGYNIKWTPKEILLNEPVNSVVELKEVQEKKEICFFDDVFFQGFEKLNRDEQIVIISIVNNVQLLYAIRLSKLINDEYNCKIIFVGNYLSYIDNALEDIAGAFPWIEYYIVGNTEESILEILQEIDIKKQEVQKPRILKNNCTENIKQGLREKVQSITDYSDLELSQYLSKKLVLPLSVSTGCFYGKCNFCSFHYGEGEFSLSSAEQIHRCLDEYVDKYNVEIINFVDKCIPIETVLEFSQYILDRNYCFKWMLETRVDEAYVREENNALLLKAGCRLISFGIESASQHLLDKMNKGLDISLAKECIKKLHETGITTAGTFMFQYPGEDVVSIQKTIDYLFENESLDLFGLMQFVLSKYSPLYFENKDKIIVKKTDLRQTFEREIVSSISVDDGSLEREIENFFSNPLISAHFYEMSSILYRSHFLFLERDKYSFQFRKKNLNLGIASDN